MKADEHSSHRVLSIDASGEVIHAACGSVISGKLSVDKFVSCNAHGWLNDFLNIKEDQEHLEQVHATENKSEKTPNITHPAKPTLTEVLKVLTNNLSGYTWDEVLLILPPFQSISLNVELPFAAKKRLEQIAPIEAQDKLPFPISQFHCSAIPLRKISDQLYDVHIGLYPKNLLEYAINSCTKLKLDPAVVTIPAALGTALSSSLKSFSETEDYTNFIAVFPSPLGYSCSIVVDKNLTGNFHLYGNPYSQNGTRPVSPLLEQSVNISVADAEVRFNTKIEKIILCGTESAFKVWNTEKLTKPTIQIKPEKLYSNYAKSDSYSNSEMLAALGILALAQNRNSHNLIPNLRSGIYSYYPQIKNLIEGMRHLTLPFLSLLTAILVTLAVRYFAIEIEMKNQSTYLNNLVKQAVPKIEVPLGQEHVVISQQIESMNNILSKIGSDTSIDTQKEYALLLNELSSGKTLTTVPGAISPLTIQRINITPERTTVEGMVSSYQEAEQLETNYKKSGSRYCSVKLDTSGSRGREGQQNFTLQLDKICTK